MAKKQQHPMDTGRDAAMATIRKIAFRAVSFYADNNIRIDASDILMDISAVHFHGGTKLRLDDLLAADDTNFIHDVAGINRHLNRETYKLENGFCPRFAQRTASVAAA